MILDARKTPNLSPELRTGIYYSTMYMSVAVVSAYLGIWLDSKGLSQSEIGLINSVPVFILLALNISVGRIADRASDWRQVIIIGCVVAAIVPVGLFFADGFWSILFLWALTIVPFMLIAPVSDAAGIRMTRRNGSDFAVLRAWGTLGNMVVLVLTGVLAGMYGTQIFVPLFLATCVLRAAASFLLPRFRLQTANNAAPAQASVPMGAAVSGLGLAKKLWFVLPLVAASLTSATLLVFYVFATLTWKNMGISLEVAGLLLAVGALSEAILMFKFAGIARRFSARHLILATAIVTGLRWVVMAFDPPIWVLVPLQVTHGISFAFGYLGVLNFVANWTSENVAAEAQSFAVVLQQAIAVVALAVFGFLFSWFGAGAFLFAAGLCVVAALGVWWSLALKPASAERLSS